MCAGKSDACLGQTRLEIFLNTLLAVKARSVRDYVLAAPENLAGNLEVALRLLRPLTRRRLHTIFPPFPSLPGGIHLPIAAVSPHRPGSAPANPGQNLVEPHA